MIPINNSDTAWLIVSDYNQENDKFYEDLREDVLNPTTNLWVWEYSLLNAGFGIMEFGVGSLGGGFEVGDRSCFEDQTASRSVGGLGNNAGSLWVGGIQSFIGGSHDPH